MKKINKIVTAIACLIIGLVTIQAHAQTVIQGDWNTQADNYKSQIGQRFTFSFPPGGSLSSRIWGTDIYTYDCSIASAAVHAGLITTQSGGTVTIEIRPAQSAYKGSYRNGAKSFDYGYFGGSFVFVSGSSGNTSGIISGGGTGSPVQKQSITPPSSGVIQGSWTTQANEYKTSAGQRLTFSFPPGGTLSTRVWGTDVYTYDCSIASAAVHAGLITTQTGGTVMIELLPGQSAYKGSYRNGVRSQDYGYYEASFRFVTERVQWQLPANSGVINGTWNTQANEYKTTEGQRLTFYFPGGGTLSSRVWGTDIYTYDCSIASAAVHAGMISLQNGGTVTIEMLPGQSAYTGSYRNGVKSLDYGAYPGSFVFVGSPNNTPISRPIDNNPVKPIQTNPPTGFGTGSTQPSGTITGNFRSTPYDYNKNIGQRYTYYFPPGEIVLTATAWGTDVYTSDSYIGTCAVHAGLLDQKTGGTVTIEMRPGQSSYTGSTRNGVKTFNWGSFAGSYVFVGSSANKPIGMPTNPVTPVENKPPTTTTTRPAGAIEGYWRTTPYEFSGRIGQRYTYYFAPGSITTNGSAWGTDVYTTDSYIGTCAVHAGLLDLKAGGVVTIEIRAGEPNYRGSVRNGVTSANWGNFPSSFVFVR